MPVDLEGLQKLHQILKLDYLERAQSRQYPNLGLGNEENNQNTINFLKESQENYQEFFRKHKAICEKLNGSKNPEKNYSILRELYMISPSVHELWFFDSHYKVRIKSIIEGRLGLKALLKARSKGYYPTYKGSITYLTKNCIMLENQFSSEGIPSLLDVTPSDDPFAEAEAITKIEPTFKSYEEILRTDIIERIFSIVHGVLRKEDYSLLKSDKLASKERWLYYGPCGINEGPLFLPKDGTKLTHLSSYVDLENPREKLSKFLRIWDYRHKLGGISDPNLISEKIDSMREEVHNQIKN